MRMNEDDEFVMIWTLGKRDACWHIRMALLANGCGQGMEFLEVYK